MEEKINNQQKIADEVYNYAAHLLMNDKKSTSETKNALLEQGLDEESASTIIADLEQEIKQAQKKQASNDMLYGGLWFIGGLIATVADFGYFFWGAIGFGGYQFLKGFFYKSKD
jgi:hypothetical protein